MKQGYERKAFDFFFLFKISVVLQFERRNLIMAIISCFKFIKFKSPNEKLQLVRKKLFPLKESKYQ